jgi:succinate dehydrogenase / fumarate reductase iron-sulfur subunit
MRLEILNDKEGVWRCRTVFNCTEACPRGIKVTQAIKEGVRQSSPDRSDPTPREAWATKGLDNRRMN